MKKKIFIVGCASILILIVLISYKLLNRTKAITPEQRWQEFGQLINKQNYEEMYTKLSKKAKKNISKEAFIERYQNIYSGIQAKDVSFTMEEPPTNDENSIAYTTQMQTIAGKVRFKQQVSYEKTDDAYAFDWTMSLILPGLGKDDKVSVQSIPATRGDLLDRNKKALATQGDILQVGIVPSRLKEEKSNTFTALSKRLNISVDAIERLLNASWVKEDMFVPIHSIPYDEKQIEELQGIQGVQVHKQRDRVYPYGKIAAHLTGYIQPISQEELKKHEGQGYSPTSDIGKNGMESIYEKELHGIDGSMITILNKDGSWKSTVLKKEAKNGTNITTTIDIELQQAIYQKLAQDEGVGVAMHPQTGEVLALVSTPTYDPNDFIIGLSTQSWNALQNDPQKPLTNRFTSNYTPGSTFKLITGAIGLDTKTILASTYLINTSKEGWQQDSSWGGYVVTTLHAYEGESNLQKALVYSDNTYFAKLAISIGATSFEEHLKQIGFFEKLRFDFGIAPSSYGTHEGLTHAIKLADTGFGQGDLNMSPLHLTSIYAAFANDGSLPQPYLKFDNKRKKVWKKQVFTKTSVEIMREGLLATMNHLGANPSKAGGKTGTAQVGKNKDELGWMCAIRDDLAITIMVEHTKDRGGSTYVVPIMQLLLNTSY